jgi:hypothetical protein
MGCDIHLFVEDEMEKSYTFSKDVVIRYPQGILKILDEEEGMVENFINTGKI